LVALLYVLQPIVRGWPRYSRGIVTTQTPRESRQRVREIARSYGPLGSLFTVHYWTEDGIERFIFLQQLVDILDRDHWQARPDSGWDEFDLEIYGDRFSKVIVRTVSENHGGQKRLIRGKLSAHWTLLAKTFFMLVLADAALLLGVTHYSLWVLPAVPMIPFVAAYLHLRARRTLRLGVALLDMTAQELGIMKLDKPRKFEKPD
jgi:hypothetical protein